MHFVKNAQQKRLLDLQEKQGFEGTRLVMPSGDEFIASIVGSAEVSKSDEVCQDVWRSEIETAKCLNQAQYAKAIQAHTIGARKADMSMCMGMDIRH